MVTLELDKATEAGYVVTALRLYKQTFDRDLLLALKGEPTPQPAEDIQRHLRSLAAILERLPKDVNILGLL